MRAWVLISVGDDRQYGGNTGYEDDPKQTYRYDSTVPNHRQLAAGDLVFIRNRGRLTGIAAIEHIISHPASKVRRRCPECGSVDIKTRRTIAPPWRCVYGHAFARPNVESIPVTAYEAHYANTYTPAPANFPTSRLKAAAIRPNDQLAIEEVDPSILQRDLATYSPDLIELFSMFEQTSSPHPSDGLSDALDGGEANPLALTPHDTRESIIRAIKERRGQRKFRNSLIRRYGPRCMVSGCRLVDLIEAAHIWPYRGPHTNDVRNGVLLRTDLHTLFDLNLLGINPETMVIALHPAVGAGGYAQFGGVFLATNGAKSPATEPLQYRWKAFQCRLNNSPSVGLQNASAVSNPVSGAAA